MTDYTNETITRLKREARARGISGASGMRKSELADALAADDAAVNADPSDFGDMPDDIEPAPDGKPVKIASEPEPVKPEPKPVTGPPPKEPKRYRLTNDISLVVNGLPRRCLAGKIIAENQYDITNVKRSGGVLVPILED